VAEGFVIKVLYDNAPTKPRWVIAGSGRGLVRRESATVFPNREAAEAEVRIWKLIATVAFLITVEPA
jgi:predicted AAA+ superfamily ATPase